MQDQDQLTVRAALENPDLGFKLALHDLHRNLHIDRESQ